MSGCRHQSSRQDNLFHRKGYEECQDELCYRRTSIPSVVKVDINGVLCLPPPLIQSYFKARAKGL